MATPEIQTITFLPNETLAVEGVFQRDGTLLSESDEFTFRLVFYILLSALFSLFGTFANIINIRVFIRLGLFNAAGNNLALFFLSLADLGVVFTNLLHSVGFSVITADLDTLPWDPFAVLYLAVGWPHTICTLANRLLTAFIALERCLCVVLPFQVKTLFTPHRTLVTLLTIVAYTVFSHVPIYLTHRLGFETQASTNVSKLVLLFGPDRDVIHDAIYYANFFVLSFSAVFIVLVCTVVMSSRMRSVNKWKQEATAVGKAAAGTGGGQRACEASSFGDVVDTDQTSHSVTMGTVVTNVTPDDANVTTTTTKNRPIATADRETRLVKMITLISTIFLVCYIPELVLIVMKYIDDRVRTNGQFHRLAHLMYSIVFVTATFNSSVNIFVYYTMNSKYRREFRRWFGRADKK